jgi:hypothetical protein
VILVSVVMPVFNGAVGLAGPTASSLAKTPRPLEPIVADRRAAACPRTP